MRAPASGVLASASHAAISASSARPASPTIGTSTGTFLLIDELSMSTWIFLTSAERVEPSGHPVVERAPIPAARRSRARQVGLVGAVHSQHAEELRIAGRVGAEAHQVLVTGKPVMRTNCVSAAAAAGPALITPPPA
jgi:hypothetical protein